MKAFDLLMSVLKANDTEQQGIMYYDDYKDFIRQFTCDNRAWVDGNLRDGMYFYYFGDTLPSKVEPDASIISGGETIVFLYRIDDFK